MKTSEAHRGRGKEARHDAGPVRRYRQARGPLRTVRPLTLDWLMRVAGEPGLDPDDPHNRDPAFIEAVLPYLASVTEPYFRPEYEDLDNLPIGESFIGVGNHNGGPILPDLWTMLGCWFQEAGVDFPAYALVHDIAFRVPIAGNVMLRLGGLRARRANAAKVLRMGGVVLVYPGGELDCYRSFWDRHTVDLHGRTGFIELALEHGVPIVPFVNIGGHETSITLYSSRFLARWTGLEWLTRVKTFPINLGLPWGLWPTGFVPFLPLPAKFVYKVGEPIRLERDPEAARDRRFVSKIYHQVTGAMQDMMDDLASRRRFPVIG